MVCCVNVRHFLGIYATFLGSLRRFGENFTRMYTTWIPRAEKPVYLRKSVAGFLQSPVPLYMALVAESKKNSGILHC